MSAVLAASTTSWLDGCGDECGWIAAGIGALAYGSFGVPVRDTHHIPVHPLVMQSFKTICFFIFGWCVVVPFLLDADDRLEWTWWGLVSGALWIVGGTGGIYAIRMAGLALAVGTWASIMILVNFIWGIGVFREPIHNVYTTAAAFGLLALGVIGMSHFSTKPKSSKTSHVLSPALNLPLLPKKSTKKIKKEKEDYDDDDDDHVFVKVKGEPEAVLMTTTTCSLASSLTAETQTTGVSSRQNACVVVSRANSFDGSHDTTSKEDTAADGCELQDDDCVTSKPKPPTEHSENNLVTFSLWGSGKQKWAWTMTQRTAGIWGAVANGILSGSSLIPLHYAKEQGLGGALYIPSFCTGALIANVVVWILLFASRYQKSIGYTLRHAMPAWHLRQLALPGMAAGTLLSVGMLGSVLATTYLGQGIGNSVVQSKILVSGLWGICYFQEVQGWQQQLKWLTSASIAVAGIVLLSQQRVTAVASLQDREDQ